MRNLVCGAALLSLVVGTAHGAERDGDVASLVSLYQQIHAHPELPHHEQQTSALLAAELRKAGYQVTERVGRYEDGSQAYGVVAVLENGPGPRLLVRSELDALPVTEETGLNYASQVKGVMHACGHDIHATTLVGTARALAANRSAWHGTLMFVAQPSEETADGARAMLRDGLYERFGRPDFAIALHDSSERAAGTVGVTSGFSQAGVVSIDVTLRGVGAHGAAPQNALDPIVMAGQFITQLQTIVSRTQDPRDPAVVSIGAIHGGAKRNVIPYEVKLELTARVFSDKAYKNVVDGVKRIADGVAVSAGVPPDRMPIVTVLEAETLPSAYNDPALTARAKASLSKALGAANVGEDEPVMYSEDFGLFGLPGRAIPVVMFSLGVADPAALAQARAEGKSLPGPHTSRFAPVPEPSLRTGVKAMTAVATTLLQ